MTKFKKCISIFIVCIILISSRAFASNVTKIKPNYNLERHCYSIHKNYNEKLYDTLLNGIQNLNSKVDVSKYSLNSNEVFKTIEKILNDHSEIFYYSDCSFWSNGIVELNYKYNINTIYIMRHTLENKVNSILNKIITPNMSQLEKEIAIHDYIVLNTKYDIDGLRSGNIDNLDFTSYGCLIKGSCVCDGYTKAMCLLLNRVGIESIRVIGFGNGQNHAWNIVKIYGKYYQVDTTWDDPIPDTGKVRYDYFNLCDDEIKLDHQFDNKDLPKCLSRDFDYFRKGKIPVKHNDKFNKIFKQYKIWTFKNDIPVDKKWEIFFNNRLKPQNLNDKVYVLDENFNKVPNIDITIKKNTLIVVNKNKYKNNSNYYLVINKSIQNLKSKSSKESIVMEFKTKK